MLTLNQINPVRKPTAFEEQHKKVLEGYQSVTIPVKKVMNNSRISKQHSRIVKSKVSTTLDINDINQGVIYDNLGRGRKTVIEHNVDEECGSSHDRTTSPLCNL